MATIHLSSSRINKMSAWRTRTVVLSTYPIPQWWTFIHSVLKSEKSQIRWIHTGTRTGQLCGLGGVNSSLYPYIFIYFMESVSINTQNRLIPSTTLCGKYVDDSHYLRQVGGFHWVLQFPPPIKLTATI